MSFAVTTASLSKRYGDRTAVDALDLEIPAGSVTGFVGPNGAGKTTTIRMLLGLVRPTGGTGEVLGVPLDRPADYLGRVGALIEGPAFTPGLSGRRNLEVLAVLAGLARDRVDRVLADVGMVERAGDRYASYSLGMKQRLGVAAALLPDPELLVLDEPTNGLDPAGIRDMRALLRSLAAAGKTVFVSSHLLSELEAICDHVVLIERGRLRFQGTIAALMDGGTHDVRVVPEHARDRDGLRALYEGARYRVRVENDALVVAAGRDRAALLNRLAMESGIVLAELRPRDASLEDVFLAITAADAPAALAEAGAS